MFKECSRDTVILRADHRQQCSSSTTTKKHIHKRVVDGRQQGNSHSTGRKKVIDGWQVGWRVGTVNERNNGVTKKERDDRGGEDEKKKSVVKFFHCIDRCGG